MSSCDRARADSAWPRDVLLYAGVAFGGAWALETLAKPLLPFPVRGGLAMLAPALGAWLVRGPAFRLGFAGAGLAPRPRAAWRDYLVAYALMPAAACAGFAISLATGLQHLQVQSPSAIFAAFGAAAPPGAQNAAPPNAATIAALIAGTLTTFIPLNVPFTFGEELGWRGYLLQRLTRYGRRNAALLVGVVWGLWHAPLIAFDHYVYPGHPVAGCALMLALTTSLSVIFAWLFFRSGSVWPAAVAHAAFNAQSNVAYIVLSPADSLLRPPGGLCSIVPLAAVALWIVATGRLDEPSSGRARLADPQQLPDPPSASPPSYASYASPPSYASYAKENP